MIPVTPALEPKQFNALVRQPGLSAIDELIGLAPRLRRPGRRRAAVARQRRSIPPDKFPHYWRDAIPMLRQAYEGRCAYLAMYLEPGTSSAGVDHFVPKSVDWRQVYEWSNYRLCAGVINGTKGDRVLLDPFKVKRGWFALEFVSFQVIVGPRAPKSLRAEIEATIKESGVNARECCQLREEYVTSFERGDISQRYLVRRAPFVADELQRERQPASR